jgi:hypothetical protein
MTEAAANYIAGQLTLAGAPIMLFRVGSGFYTTWMHFPGETPEFTY